MHFELAISFLVGLIVGGSVAYWIANRLYKALRSENIQLEKVQQRQNDQDLQAYMQVLRREVGNWMMQHQPSALLKAYDHLLEYEEKLRSSQSSFRQDEIRELSDKYPFFTDLDMLGTRHFVLYGDAFESYTDDEVAAQYMDISKFLCLMVGSERTLVISSQNEREILVERIEKYSNRNLCEKAQEAMARYFRQSDTEEDFVHRYEDEEYRVLRLPTSNPSIEYGIELRRTNEFAVYETFTGDDDRTYQSIYRTNSSFDERNSTI